VLGGGGGDGERWLFLRTEPGAAKMSDRKTSDAKFVQITTSVHGGEILLYALDESGDVWRFDDKTRRWVMLPRDRR
jgi:hypothetical protein